MQWMSTENWRIMVIVAGGKISASVWSTCRKGLHVIHGAVNEIFIPSDKDPVRIEIRNLLTSLVQEIHSDKWAVCFILVKRIYFHDTSIMCIVTSAEFKLIAHVLDTGSRLKMYYVPTMMSSNILCSHWNIIKQISAMHRMCAYNR